RPSDSADRRGSKTGGVTLSLWLDEAAFGNLSKRLCRLYQSQLDSVLNHRYRPGNEKIGVQKKSNEVSRARKHLKLNNHILNIPAPDVSLCYDDVRTRRHVHSGVSVIPQRNDFFAINEDLRRSGFVHESIRTVEINETSFWPRIGMSL